jgi:hypothetical protein
MRTRLFPTSLLTLSLALAGTATALAQDTSADKAGDFYSTGAAVGEMAGVVEPTVETPTDGVRQMRGLSLVGIPIEMSDPRVSGQLTISANGSGGDFEHGFANIESRTYRLENDGGVWTGSGQAIESGTEDGPLLSLETAILAGADGYDGLTAFMFTEGVETGRDLQIVVIENEVPPAPEPVPATALEDAAAS